MELMADPFNFDHNYCTRFEANQQQKREELFVVSFGSVFIEYWKLHRILAEKK